jgi:hypothetical protein
MEPTPSVSHAPEDVEPIATAEGVRLVLLALLGVLEAFSVWSPTGPQYAALAGLYAAVSVLLAGWARRRSTPNVKVALTTNELRQLRSE